MSNLNEQIIKTVNNHINNICKDYEETNVLLESLPMVVGLKKRIIELEKEVLVLKRQLLINDTEEVVEKKIDKILTKNINLEVIEKDANGIIISEEEIEKEVAKKDPASLFSGSLWDFSDGDDDDGEAYVYESDDQNSGDEENEDDDENDIDGPILAQLKALGLNPESIKQIKDEEEPEITSVGTIDEDDEEDTSVFSTTNTELETGEETIDTGIASEEDDEELVGAEKWAVEMIKREQAGIDNEEEEEEEVEEIEIDGEMYYTTDKKNGIIYEYLQDEEVGDEVGHLEDGILFLS